MKGLYNYVLPERDEPDARIISVMALLDVSGSTSSATIDALIERWGQPSPREVPIAKVRYSTCSELRVANSTGWRQPGR